MTESGWEAYLSAEVPAGSNMQEVTDTLQSGETASQDAASDSGDPTGGYGDASKDLGTAAWATQNASEEANLAASSADTSAEYGSRADSYREQAATDTQQGWGTTWADFDLQQANQADTFAARAGDEAQTEAGVATDYMGYADTAAGNADQSLAIATTDTTSVDTTNAAAGGWDTSATDTSGSDSSSYDSSGGDTSSYDSSSYDTSSPD